MLTGIWHGASFSFVLWGVWHGLFNLTERIIRKCNENKPQKEHSAIVTTLISVVQHIYTLLVVMVGWVFFRVPGLKNGLHYLMSMFGLYNDTSICYLLPSHYLDRWTIMALILGVTMATPIPSKVVIAIGKRLPETVASVIRDIVLLAVLILCVMQVASNTYSAFIYFQF